MQGRGTSLSLARDSRVFSWRLTLWTFDIRDSESCWDSGAIPFLEWGISKCVQESYLGSLAGFSPSECVSVPDRTSGRTRSTTQNSFHRLRRRRTHPATWPLSTADSPGSLHSRWRGQLLHLSHRLLPEWDLH